MNDSICGNGSGSPSDYATSGSYAVALRTHLGAVNVDLAVAIVNRLDACLATYQDVAQGCLERYQALCNGAALTSEEEMNFGPYGRVRAIEINDTLRYEYKRAIGALTYARFGYYPNGDRD